MTTPQALHHSLLRPCILQILRAAGYHSTRPSVLDTLTDLAARYMFLLAQTTARHASVNQHDPELALEISIQDVRMAMQDSGALLPERVLEEQQFYGQEDTRGVDAFIAWAMGKVNSEIRRVGLEGSDGAKEDYLTGLSCPAPAKLYLTRPSSQEEAQYDRRRNAIHWDDTWQAYRTEDYQSRGERGHKS
jgi:transcription initiation factor TFIID subunit 3